MSLGKRLAWNTKSAKIKVVHIEWKSKGLDYVSNRCFFFFFINVTLTTLLTDRLEIHPRMLRLDDSVRSPLTVDRSNYSQSTEAKESHGPYVLNDFDAERSQGRDWVYLLKILESGILFCVRRGKYLLMAAGRVGCLFILFE